MTVHQPVLKVDRVTKVFDYDLFKKKEVALKDLTLAFKENTCSGLLGHNGAGKTTTIRVIFGLITPDSGSVAFRGQPIRRKDFQKFGYMPEINKLAANLTPEESLAHHLNVYEGFARNRKARKTSIDGTLEKVGLAQHRKKRINKLSKGLQRRLAWAMATIHQPEVLILDEPFSGLDPLGRSMMSQWIEAEKFRGASIILCTHDLMTARRHCQELFILRKGEVVYSSNDETSRQSDAPAVEPEFELTVSGVEAAQLEKLRDANHLPEWLSLEDREFLCNLTFANYGSATLWLQCVTNQGLVVTRFAERASLANDDILLTYFDTREVNP